MMPYHQLYQAERLTSAAERRQAEMRPGRAAAGTSELRARLTRMARATGRRLRRRGTCPLPGSS